MNNKRIGINTFIFKFPYKILYINQKAYLLNLMNIIFKINFSKYNKFHNEILF